MSVPATARPSTMSERRWWYHKLREHGVDRHTAAATVGTHIWRTYKWEPSNHAARRHIYTTARQAGFSRHEAASAARVSLSASYLWEPGDPSNRGRAPWVDEREDFRWLLTTGESLELAAERVGISIHTAREWERANRTRRAA